MRCAVMQPMYLPWAGYFNLIASVDTFVLLDDVQFERQSWQMRNRILLNGEEVLLSVPTQRVPLDTQIRSVQVADAARWRHRHATTLQQAYGSAPYGAVVLERVLPVIEDTSITSLADLNVAAIRTFIELLDLPARLLRASDLCCGGKRTDHVIALCERVGATVYVSPEGSREYLVADDFVGRSGMKLEFQQFTPQPYVQSRSATFVSHLSIVDVLANLGPDRGSAYVRGQVA
jgi:WbqC-like protein